ncbi:MAG: hypothetical protein IPL61_06735 [Myxococcales bacterium]|nr:hypothetical protein [Myxococcales bacterium]
MVAGPAILDGSQSWKGNYVPATWDVASFRDDNRNGAFDFWTDPATPCDDAGPEIVCRAAGDRVVVRVVDGKLSEVYLQGGIDLVACASDADATCRQLATESRGIYRFARACTVDLSNAQLRLPDGSRSSAIETFGLKMADDRTPRAELTDVIAGATLDLATPTSTGCSVADDCHAWRRHTRVWSLPGFRHARIDLIDETRTPI